MIATIKRIFQVIYQPIIVIGALFGLLLGFFQIRDYISPKEPALIAKCEFNDIPALPASKLSTNKKDEIALTLDSFFSRNPSAYLTCLVENSGKSEAEEIILSVPFHSVAGKIGSNEIEINKEKASDINLGYLRPKAKVRIIIWTTNPFGYVTEYQNEDSYTLTFKGGQGDILIATNAYGLLGKFARFFK